MRFTVKGIGWVTPWGIGSGQRGETLRLGPGRLPALTSRQFLAAPHPRFGRFDSYARAGFGAIALALHSARLDHGTHKRAIGLVVGTRCGCLEADRAYFRTAVCDGGTGSARARGPQRIIPRWGTSPHRDTSRSGTPSPSPTREEALGSPSLASPNLFAYTLPSTMLGEASIQFGLTGAAFVVDDSDGHLAGIQAALDLLRWGLGETVVGGWCDVDAGIVPAGAERPSGAVFFVLAKGPEAAPWRWDGRELLHGTQQVTHLDGLARKVLELSPERRGDECER